MSILSACPRPVAQVRPESRFDRYQGRGQVSILSECPRSVAQVRPESRFDRDRADSAISEAGAPRWHFGRVSAFSAEERPESQAERNSAVSCNVRRRTPRLSF